MILDSVKNYFSKASGYPCRFYIADENTKECTLYLDSEIKIDQNIDNNQRIFYVSGSIFVISAKDKCSSLNEIQLIKITENMKDCQFSSEININAVHEVVKYSIDFFSLPVKEQYCYNSKGIIKEIKYIIKE